MARRNWSTQYKTEILTAYARIIRKSSTMTVVGTDSIANRAHFLHKAQEEVCCDPDLKRDITAAFATMFLRQHKSILESVRSRTDLQLKIDKERVETKQDAPKSHEEAEENVVAADTETAPLAPFQRELGENDAEHAASMGVGECRTILNAPRNAPIAAFAMQTAGVLESMKALVAALQPLTNVEFDKIIADVVKAASGMEVCAEESKVETPEPVVVQDVVEKVVYVPEPTAFVGRKPGELRVVFDSKPSVIIAGFQPELTKNVLTRLKDILPYTRAQYSALMQCLVEHPDASVLILSDSIKMNPRIEYLTRALEIQVIQVPNTRDGLEEAIDHVNGYTVKAADRPDVVGSDVRNVVTKTSAEDGAAVIPMSQHFRDGKPVEVEQKPDEDESEEDPDFPPVDRRVVFITHSHSQEQRNEIRLRFTKYLDVRYCEVGDLDRVLVGHKYPAILHYASVPPAQAHEVIRITQATMYYVRSTYMDAFGKLVELEASVKSQ